MKITKLKIIYVNGDKEEIQLGKKWTDWVFTKIMLHLRTKDKDKYIPLTSILYFIVEEIDDKQKL